MADVIEPKYYAIDNWRQATNATSNIDSTLKIRYTQFVNSHIIEGGRLQVVHPEYGVLFACLTSATGSLVDYDPNAFLDTASILLALRQLGFDIKFKTNPALNAETRQFLESARLLGYTSIRWVVKKHKIQTNAKVFDGNCLHKGCAEGRTRIVVCFDSNKRPELLNQFPPPIKNFGGDILEVDFVKNPKLDFSWLTLPMDIESILEEG